MSVERLGLIVVGMLVLLVLVLFVSTAMVWVAMLLEERGVWLRTILEGLSGEPRGCEVLLSEGLDRILRRIDGP
jgi:hypothetical protein